MNEPQKKSYDMAAEATKQIITLSSATLVLAATVLRDSGSTLIGRGLILAAYIALLTSILFGVRMMYVLTSALAGIRTDDNAAVPMVTHIPGARRAAALQHSFFGTGLALLAAFGFLRLVGI